MHFIRPKDVGSFPRTTRGLRPAVCCHHEKRDGEDVLIVTTEEPLRLVKPGVSLAVVPERVKILSSSGEVLRATHKFWVTMETFNPYHLVLDHLDP